MPSPDVTVAMIEKSVLDPTAKFMGLNDWAVYKDEFFQGGYVSDAGLSSESDPGAKFSDVADRGEWLVTYDATPTIVISDAEPGGVLTATTGSSANDFVSMQLNGEGFAVQTDKNMIFEARVKVADSDDTRWFVGLASTDVTGTTIGPILDGVNDSIGFRQNTDTGQDIHCVTEDDTTETDSDTGVDIADDTFRVLRFEVDRDSEVRFFVDGILKKTHSTNLPDAGAGLTPTVEVHSPTASSNIEIDYIVAAVQR